jgi:ABC-type microcin C transport system permease subunit YejE
MKRLTLNFLVVMLLFSWIGVEVAVRNQIVSGTDIETYNSLYQKALDCPNKKIAPTRRWRYIIPTPGICSINSVFNLLPHRRKRQN